MSTTPEDLEIENDVRAMEDEADHLRRNSRAHTTVDHSLRSALNPVFQFPSCPPDPDRGKSKVVDTTVLLPAEETPQIERNKLLRQGAMAAIAQERGREVDRRNGITASGHRRKSSINSRGKRISSSFEATGVISEFFLLISSLCPPELQRHIQLSPMVQSRTAVSTNTLIVTFLMSSVFANF